MSTRAPARPVPRRRPRAHAAAPDENAQLVREVEQLVVALARLTRENGDLRRRLAQALRGIDDGPRAAAPDRVARIQEMLRDRHSCNP